MGILTVNSDFEKLFGVTEREYYTKQYLTFEALEDGEIQFNFGGLGDLGYESLLTYIAYSTDNGETWTTEEYEQGKQVSIDLKQGETVMFKADGFTGCVDEEMYASFSSEDNTQLSSMYFNVYGNIMSLVYGDDFYGKEMVEDPDWTFGFYYLFGYSSIVSAEDLILPNNTIPLCYCSMFEECGSLEKAPELPATTLADTCYGNMFYDCTSLTTAPELPATTLTNNCYSSMFNGCTSLTTAPELPATTLVSNCYDNMFYGCSNLNYIKMLATDVSAEYCLNDWASLVAEEGTLIINKDYEGLRRALNVPATWTILNEDGTPHIFPRDYSEEYLTFECIVKDGGDNFDFNIPLGGTDFSVTSVSYSLDNGQTWTTYTNEGNDINISLNLSAGDKILLKGNARNYASQHLDYDSPAEDYSNIHLMGDWLVYGNIMSLFYGDNFVGETSFPKDGSNNSKYNCAGLFYHNDECIMGDLSNLILPATTLTQNCYYMMFADCPDAITKAPELPATTLAVGCYANMFNGCTSLTTAPELPATTLANYCYGSMFNGCTNLNYIKAMFTTTPSSSYTYNWVNGVAASGTFVKNRAATWNVTGVNGIPTGWTVETA